MKLSEERLAEYNARINEWVSQQGLLFQLTFSGSGLGQKAPVWGQLVKFLMVLVVLGIVGFFAYVGILYWKASSSSFGADLQKGLSSAMKVESPKVRGFDRKGTTASVTQVLAEGSDTNFFDVLEARRISFQMPMTAGILGVWNAGTLLAEESLISLKAGAASDVAAASAWNSLFQLPPDFDFQRIDSIDTTVNWGYSSPATWGSIRHAKLSARRSTGRWQLLFKEGFLSQGMFRDLPLTNMTVTLDQQQGVTINEAAFSEGPFQLNFSARVEGSGTEPTLTGTGNFRQMPIKRFLPPILFDYLGGTISGSFEISGSPNDSRGLSFTINARLQDDDELWISNEFPYLQLLRNIDAKNSYRKITFKSGSFTIKSLNKNVLVEDVNLTAPNLLGQEPAVKIRGNFVSRPVTPEELDRGYLDLASSLDITSSPTVGASSRRSSTEAIANILADYQFPNDHQQLYLKTEDDNGDQLRVPFIAEKPRRKARLPHFIEGDLEMALPKNVLESPFLAQTEVGPDEDSDLYWCRIPLGAFSSQLTLSIYERWEKSLWKK